ncbi:MAG TPA: hypothetical protein VEK08_15025 [Planctomycetota bacterium]|nr:hypothetical protein [Planctomycetota bacterium]
MKLDPEFLKRSVQKLIPDFQALHARGGGEVQLSELAALLNLPLDERMSAVLQQRGSMHFKATGGDEGTFENRGAEVQVPAPAATIVFPPLIAGIYRSTPGELEIRFDPKTAIAGRNSFVTAPVELVRMTAHKFHVKVGGMLGPMLSRTVDLP